MRVILAWTGQEATVARGGPLGPAPRRPDWESSSGVSAGDEPGRPHRDERFPSMGSFTERSPIFASASGEADLGDPVVQTPALLAEQVQLLQRGVLPSPVHRWVLLRQERETEFRRVLPFLHKSFVVDS